MRGTATAKIPEPNKESWFKVAEEFYKQANFPNWVGAMDSKHIGIVNPDYWSGSIYQSSISTIIFIIVLM